MLSKSVYDSSGNISHFTGLNGDTIGLLAEIMNFTPIYVPSKDGAYFGSQVEGGNFTGSLAALENEQVDLAAIARFITNYNTTKSQFLYPIISSRQVFIIAARPIPKTQITYFFMYDDHTKKVFTLLMLFFPLLMILFEKFESRLYRETEVPCGKSIMIFIAMLCNISMKHSKRTATRIIIFSLLFFALIETSLFQGNITKNLNFRNNTKEINTIKQLMDSDLVLDIAYSLSYVLRDVSGNRCNDKLREIARAMRGSSGLDYYEEMGIDQVLNNKSIAFLMSSLYAYDYLDQFYDNETGENLLTHVEQSPFQFYKSMMAPKDSPFINNFNFAILKICESGLFSSTSTSMQIEFNKNMIYRIKHGFIPKTGQEKLSLYQLLPTFQVFLVLHGIAFLLFLGEILFKKFQVNYKNIKDSQVFMYAE